MLRRIVAKYGKDLCGDAKRCKGLLKDLCGKYNREINVLTNAVEERVALDLLAAENSMPRELLLSKLSKRLEDDLGLTAEASDWAVDSWALALGILTDAEIEAKEKKRNDSISPQISSAKRSEPIQQTPKIQPPSQNRQNQQRQFPPQSRINPPTAKVNSPPVARQPANFPTPAPKQPVQKSGSNVNAPQNLPQQNNSAVNQIPKKRFRKFFGCLFVFFLLIASGVALVFVVPYAIKVMRETQQQNEPPRFPTR